MKIEARFDLFGSQGPDPWADSWGTQLPLEHIICRGVDGTPYSIQEFIWPWTAYTKEKRKFVLHFYYWKQKRGTVTSEQSEMDSEREARIRELQFLMTRQLYYGSENAPRTLVAKLETLRWIARFAEARCCTVSDVLTEASLLNACNASLPDSMLKPWISLMSLFRRLDPVRQLGFALATPHKDLVHRYREYSDSPRQHPALPTRIYSELINNLSAELDDIEANAPRLLAALRDALAAYQQAKARQRSNDLCVGPAVIARHGLNDYLGRRGLGTRRAHLKGLASAVSEIFLVCKLQIHVFSGMRHDEARTLPYHCMVVKNGEHGRRHALIAGITTKLNKGRCLRTNWVTIEEKGFRAIRLAQGFASIIYESLGVNPCEGDAHRDEFPLFPSVDYLPWGKKRYTLGEPVRATNNALHNGKEQLHARLFPSIEEDDIAELEEIDPFRTWRDEAEFCIGHRWPLTTHQLRRSLAVYANASGVVRLSSLRRQLQHITQEMSLYYGRGSSFCKNFIANDLEGFKKHVAFEWQSGEDEATVLAFTREVLNSNEPMFGGAGAFYQMQKERGEVMSHDDVKKRMKAGLLSYRPTPFGGCTKSGACDRRKALALIDISCATEGCKHLVGKHSKIIRLIRLKRAGMVHITPDSIEGEIEKEELEALERVERDWRP